jgi:hypothetical protein
MMATATFDSDFGDPRKNRFAQYLSFLFQIIGLWPESQEKSTTISFIGAIDLLAFDKFDTIYKLFLTQNQPIISFTINGQEKSTLEKSAKDFALLIFKTFPQIKDIYPIDTSAETAFDKHKEAWQAFYKLLWDIKKRFDSEGNPSEPNN